MSETTAPVPASPAAASSSRTWIARIVLFLGAWFVLLAAQEACYSKAHRVRGTVVEKGYTAGSSAVGRGGRGTKSSHWVRYRFETPEGESKEHVDSEVLPATWGELREGAAVDLEYLPATGDSRVAGQKAASSTYAAIAIGLLALGFWLRRSARRAV